MNQLPHLEANLGYQFKDKVLLQQALTHRSHLNENRSLNLVSNERLEFLGDAVLETWASIRLYHQFPTSPEGDLTNLRSLLVRTESLSQTAIKIDLGKFVLLSKGEEAHGGRLNQSILADTFESIIGAIYLDGGFANSDAFLDRLLLPSLEVIRNQKNIKDPKSYYQEIAQNKFNLTPHYLSLSESGPDHAKTFVVGVYLGDKLIAQGSGNSKQKAEESAAILATELTLETR
ncbi:MAG: ribonuclease III [Candidatus Shapirobacteria bacterium]|jgi:ribonuclease-3